MKKKTYSAALPGFPGFYESFLDHFIDQEIEYEMEGDGKPGDKYYRPKKTWEEVDQYANYSAAHRAIAQAWVETFASDAGLDMEFEEMVSPREYNFTTDRVFATFGKKTLDKLKSVRNSNIFAEVVKKHFTSRSGFISFYDSDCDSGKWVKPVEEWDHNQLMALIEAYIIARVDDDFGHFLEEIIEDPHVYEAAQHVWDKLPEPRSTEPTPA